MIELEMLAEIRCRTWIWRTSATDAAETGATGSGTATKRGTATGNVIATREKETENATGTETGTEIETGMDVEKRVCASCFFRHVRCWKMRSIQCETIQ